MGSINRPFLGHFASYQSNVFASISRNMLRDDFSQVFLPTTDAIISGKKSLHLNQYPFPSLLVALAIKCMGGSFEFWGRFQAIIFNLFSILLIGLIARRLFNPKVGWLTAVFYALSPYTLIYGQVFLSEAMALCFLLLSAYLLVRMEDFQYRGIAIVGVAFCFSVAVTGRIHFVLLYPAWIVYLLLKTGPKGTAFALFFSAIAFLMPVWWYAHTYFEAFRMDNVHTSLFLQMGLPRGERGLSFFNLEYFKGVLDIFSHKMLTPILFPFFLLGMVLVKKRGGNFWFVILGFVGGVLPVIFVPEKVIKHDFYLYACFPFVAILAACGVAPLLEAFPLLKSKRMILGFLFLYLAVSSRYFLHPVFKHPEGENNTVAVAQYVGKNTKPDDRLIVAGRQPAALSFYADRALWVLDFDRVGYELPPYYKNSAFKQVDRKEIARLEQAMKNPISWLEYLREQGASYIVIQHWKDLEDLSDLCNYLQKHYVRISPSEAEFGLFRLSRRLQ